jgi:tetraacyldisaccharide-1-P 4'-kinase
MPSVATAAYADAVTSGVRAAAKKLTTKLRAAATGEGWTAEEAGGLKVVVTDDGLGLMVRIADASFSKEYGDVNTPPSGVVRRFIAAEEDIEAVIIDAVKVPL